jgi:hypothetical protein
MAAFAGEDPTRQMTLPTSSATSKLPARSIATPTGRPNASRSALKPVRTSTGCPAGRPGAKGTLIAAARLAIP